MKMTRTAAKTQWVNLRMCVDNSYPPVTQH